jgi:hypothetical protein
MQRVVESLHAAMATPSIAMRTCERSPDCDRDELSDSQHHSGKTPPFECATNSPFVQEALELSATGSTVLVYYLADRRTAST